VSTLCAKVPSLSVVVPARNCAEVLEVALAALVASDLERRRWELIVVDDASSDGTGAVAERYADRIVRLTAPARGPAHGRNEGARVCQGKILVFLDADVRVYPDTLTRFLRSFEEDPGLDAVFGSYDAHPPAEGTVSQYRNLLHHYVHVSNPGPAESFWSGCGAIRRAAFEHAEGFDDGRYRRPQIEDIDLGYRLRRLGYRILLDPRIEVTHLKRWTLAGMIVTDVRDRGVPWMKLLLSRGRRRPATLSAGPAEQRHTLLAAMSVLSFAAAVSVRSAALLALTLLLSTAIVVGNRRLFSWFAERRGTAFALRTVPLRLSGYYLNVLSAFLALVLHGASARHPAPAAVARGKRDVRGVYASSEDPPAPAGQVSAAGGGSR